MNSAQSGSQLPGGLGEATLSQRLRGVQLARQCSTALASSSDCDLDHLLNSVRWQESWEGFPFEQWGKQTQRGRRQQTWAQVS